MFAAARHALQQGKQCYQSFTTMGFSPDREYLPLCTDMIGIMSRCSVMSGISWIRWVSALEETGQACDP